MMTSQIVRFEDSAKTQNSKYPENEILFFPSDKKAHSL